jgi:S1-C subfamily serine protease
MTPTIGEGQDRTRTRLSTRPELAPLLNIYTERQSRTRLGLYLDVDQSRRFDGDGALITGVMRDSPAEDAGLEEGDVITVFEGQVLTIPLDDSDRERDFDLDQSLPAQRLLALARDLEEGQTVEIRYLRDGANNTVSVEADEFEFPEVRTFGGRAGVWGVAPDVSVRPFPRYDDLVPEIVERMEGLQYRLRDFTGDLAIAEPGYSFSFGVTSAEGVEFIELNPELGEYFGSDSGVLVVEADEESTLGLMAGDVVLAVGAREAESVRRVLRLIRSYDEDEPIRFRIIRMGSEMVAEGVLQ